MAIETHIPKEITDYKERLIGEFSGRQLASIGGCLAVVGASYVILVLGLHLSMDVYPYIVMLLVAPIFMIGFYKRDKMPFEQYIRLLIRHYFGTNKLSWAAEFDDVEIEKSFDHAATTATEGVNENVREREKGRSSDPKQEIEITTEKGFAAATKEIQREIKRAKAECRAVQRAYKKARKK